MTKIYHHQKFIYSSHEEGNESTTNHFEVQNVLFCDASQVMFVDIHLGISYVIHLVINMSIANDEKTVQLNKQNISDYRLLYTFKLRVTITEFPN